MSSELPLFGYSVQGKKAWPVKMLEVPTHAHSGKPYEQYKQVITLPEDERRLSLEELQRKYPYKGA